jgi:hypothetical protein
MRVYLFGPRRPVCLAVGASIIIQSYGGSGSGEEGLMSQYFARKPIIIRAPETSAFGCGRCANYPLG